MNRELKIIVIGEKAMGKTTVSMLIGRLLQSHGASVSLQDGEVENPQTDFPELPGISNLDDLKARIVTREG